MAPRRGPGLAPAPWVSPGSAGQHSLGEECQGFRGKFRELFPSQSCGVQGLDLPLWGQPGCEEQIGLCVKQSLRHFGISLARDKSPPSSFVLFMVIWLILDCSNCCVLYQTCAINPPVLAGLQQNWGYLLPWEQQSTRIGFVWAIKWDTSTGGNPLGILSVISENHKKMELQETLLGSTTALHLPLWEVNLIKV